MKHNNKGFTFVELIVGIVIFGIVTAAALGFLVTASRTYGSVNGAMNQRLDAQLAVNQIEEYLIDCNGTVSFSDSVLTITNSDAAYVFKLSGGQVLFGSDNAQSATALLVDGVTDFSVDLSSSYATISITTEKRGKTLEQTRTVALRNKPEIVNSN